jgi:hypothetical protein
VSGEYKNGSITVSIRESPTNSLVCECHLSHVYALLASAGNTNNNEQARLYFLNQLILLQYFPSEVSKKCERHRIGC